jgi:hypothetical protein
MIDTPRDPAETDNICGLVIKYPRRTLGDSREPVSGVLPLVGGDAMSEDRDNLSSDKKTEERDTLLTMAIRLVPLFDLVIRLLELLLRILRIIN